MHLLFLGAACQQKRTQVMVGIATDIDAPAPLSDVQLQIFDLDQQEQLPFTDLAWQLSGLPNQQFELPGSFGVFSPNGEQSRIRILLTGFSAGVAIQRSATLRLVEEQTLFMRMALVSRCMSAAQCQIGQTCVEGQCRAEEVDPQTLPKFVDGMEKRVTCDSGTLFANTSTKLPLPMEGPGCTANEFCLEGTCYKRLTGKKRVGEPCASGDECVPGSICFSDFCVGMGSLRVSLKWTAVSDFDLHLAMPDGTEIFFGNREAGGGVLDVDQCVSECAGDTHVENIVFANAPPRGAYRVWVENFSAAAAGAFTLEIAGSVTATFSGTLPMVEDVRSEEFMFSVP